MITIWLLICTWLAPPPSPTPFFGADEPVSYAEDIVPIIEAKCAVKGCHDGTVVPSLDTHETVQAYAESISSRVNDRIIPMPPRYAKEPLTPKEKADLLAWLAAGAPNN